MNDVIRAALAPVRGRFLLIEPPSTLVIDLARLQGASMVTALHRGRRRARRSREKLAAVKDIAGKTSVVRGSLDHLPLVGASVEAVVCARGLPHHIDPVDALRSLRRAVRPGGLVLVVSRLREGPIGVIGSLLRRAAWAGDLPRASDLTAWMLHAGMRSVRQAVLPRTVVPGALTWAQVRHRPWEEEAPTVAPPSSRP